MPMIGSIRPADQSESPDELRGRALIIRGHATMLWRDEAVPSPPQSALGRLFVCSVVDDALDTHIVV